MHLLSDPWFVALALIGVSLIGLSKGGFFGMGVIALPLMALSVPPLEAAAILLPTVIAQDMLTVWTYRRHWSAWNLKIMVPSMAAGMVVATVSAAAMSAAHIRLIIGLIAGAFVVRYYLGDRLERLSPKPSTATGIVFGAIGGFSTMLANAGSPAWQMHLLPQRLEKLTFVGTVVMLFGISNLLKIPAYGSLGLVTWENFVVGITLLPVAMLSTYLGIWLVRRVPTELFYRVAYVLMALIALELIRGSVLEIWRG
jgi:uncharacterized membrane protein YfcA